MTVQARIDVLARELQQQLGLIDFSVLSEVTEPQIMDTLHQKGRGQVDVDIIDQLLDRFYEKKEDNNLDAQKLTWKSFLIVYIEAEEVLKAKISNLKKLVEDCRAKRTEEEARLSYVRTVEQLNQYGISLDSHLVAVVRTLKLIQNDTTRSLLPYVSIKVGDNQPQKTPSLFGHSIQYDATFQFQVFSGLEAIEVNVMNNERGQFGDALIGTVVIPIASFEDQCVKQEVFQLQGYENKEVGSIELEFQWLHSQGKQLMKVLEQWSDNIAQREQILAETQSDLKGLYLLFPEYAFLFQPEQLLQVPIQHPFQSLTNAPLFFDQHKSEFVKIELKGAVLQGEIEIKRLIFQIVVIMLGIFALITQMSLIYRPQFFDWMIILGSILFHELKVLDHIRAKSILYAIGASIAFDFFWLFVYSTGWWRGHSDSDTEIVDKGLRRYTMAISLLAFLYKFPFGLAVYKFQRELERVLGGNSQERAEKAKSNLNFNRTHEYQKNPDPLLNDSRIVQVPMQNSRIPVPGSFVRVPPTVQPLLYGSSIRSIAPVSHQQVFMSPRNVIRY